MKTYHRHMSLAHDMCQRATQPLQGLQGLLTAMLLDEAHDGIRHDDHPNDDSLHIVMHSHRQTHGTDQNKAHDIDEVLEEEDDGVDTFGAFQGIFAKGLAAHLHGGLGDTFVGIDLCEHVCVCVCVCECMYV